MTKKTPDKPFKLPERKTRSIEDISKQYQDAKAIATQFHEKQWIPWYNEGDKLKSFWGYDRDEGIHKRIKVAYSFSDNGYSNSRVYPPDYKLIAQVAEPQDLPLMLNDPKYEKSRDHIIAILKGDLLPSVKRQDLVDEHCYLRERDKHINRVKHSYLNMLKFYVREKFRDKIYDPFNHRPFLIIAIGEYIYHFNFEGMDIKLVENIEYYTVRPEEAIKTPFRLDTCY